jgi:hypothetical protein
MPSKHCQALREKRGIKSHQDRKALPEKRREEIEKREDVRYELSSSKTNRCDDAQPKADQNEPTMKPEQPTNQTYGPQARAVLHMLNEVAGRNFQGDRRKPEAHKNADSRSQGSRSRRSEK